MGACIWSQVIKRHQLTSGTALEFILLSLVSIFFLLFTLLTNMVEHDTWTYNNRTDTLSSRSQQQQSTIQYILNRWITGNHHWCCVSIGFYLLIGKWLLSEESHYEPVGHRLPMVCLLLNKPLSTRTILVIKSN